MDRFNSERKKFIFFQNKVDDNWKWKVNQFPLIVKQSIVNELSCQVQKRIEFQFEKNRIEKMNYII